MSDAIWWRVKTSGGTFDVEEWAAKTRAAWANAPEKTKNAIRYNFARYLGFVVGYVKKNKLSGQVLGKNTGAYDLVGGNPKWRRTPGTLKKTFGARTEERSQSVRGTFYETIYGAAWERGFTRKAYTVVPKHQTAAGKLGWLVFFGKGRWRYSQRVEIPAQTFPAKPHIQPSIDETQPQFRSMVMRPLANLFRGLFGNVRQVGDKL